jgi:hypothetical protein
MRYSTPKANEILLLGLKVDSSLEMRPRLGSGSSADDDGQATARRYFFTPASAEEFTPASAEESSIVRT